MVNITQQRLSRPITPAGFITPQLSPGDSIVARAGYYALLVWLFAYLSRVLDVTVPFLRIPLVLNVVWAVGALAGGGLLLFFRNRVGIFIVAFTAWAAVTVPLGVWRGGSFDTYKTLLRSVVLAMAVMALVKTTAQCRQVLYTLGFAVATAAVISRVSGEHSANGRLALSSGSFADPNYYCIILVAGMPFLLLKSSAAIGRVKRYIPLFLLFGVLAVALKTGSRSGMVGMAATFLVYFLGIPLQRKIKFVVAAACVAVLVMSFASEQVLQRYKTMFDSDASAEESTQLTDESELALKTAVSSTNARRYLFFRSLEMTAKHPIFGLGIGAFQMGEAKDARSKGFRPTWHETHNLYTQVSSETGIPGLLLYVAALIAAQRMLSQLCKLKGTNSPGLAAVCDSALHLRMSFIGAMIAAIFLAMAYNGLMFLLLALSAALHRAAQTEFAAEFATRPAPWVPASPAPTLPRVTTGIGKQTYPARAPKTVTPFRAR